MAGRYEGETEDGQFRAEILATGETHWAGNALRFDTRENAENYGHDLARRWTQAQAWRAVDIKTPERMHYVPGTEDGSWG